MQERDHNSAISALNTCAAVIVAGGSGTRAGAQQGRPKQYCLIGGKPVLRQTVLAFANYPRISHVIVVIRPGDEPLYLECMDGIERDISTGAMLLQPTHGGATRQLSVAAGLKALESLQPSAVLIHDAARPFITADSIGKTIDALKLYDGSISSAPVTDTLKRAGEAGEVVETVARAGLWRAETPQTFHYDKILAAHRAAVAEGRSDFTDDAALAEWRGLNIALVEGASGNMKITTAHDLKMADLIQRQAQSPLPAGIPDIRTGSGYDVHAFEDGDHVTLCGVKIPHTKKLNGHSDADAPLHALTDAILGTIGAGDIGDHFPPSDPQWRGAPSNIFLKRAHELVSERGGVITNVDIMIVAEAPKIGPHREAMRAHIAQTLGLAMERVSVKATTNEKLGFVGRNEGIAAMATATLVFQGA